MAEPETAGAGERVEPVIVDRAGGGEAGAPTSGGGLERTASMARPLVLPETFDGACNWNDWYFHFENVASVNGWDSEQKLKWLRVRMTGRAQKALHRLPASATVTFEATRDALKARFDPESRCTRFQAEFQARRKKAAEGWADFADDLRSLADKAYPTLQEEARERLSINAYLAQLPQPQIAFSVRQKQPATLDDAVAATLEMESYMPPHMSSGINSTLPAEDRSASVDVDSVDKVDQLARVVERLAEQVERLQQVSDSQRQPRRARRGFTGECWNCGQTGHLSRDCPLPQGQGN